MLNDTALAVLLLLLGGILARVSLDGDYLRYVKPGMLWLLLTAAAALFAIGGATLWHEVAVSEPKGKHAAVAAFPAPQ